MDEQKCCFTHRTSHGAHGVGDKTTLGESAEATMSELQHAYPRVFQEPVYPVNRDIF